MIKTTVAILMLVCIHHIFSQHKKDYTISGNVKDKNTGESLIGAMIKVKETRDIGANSNEYGFYSVTLGSGNFTIIASYVGYESDTMNVILNSNKNVDFFLSEMTLETEEITVTDTSKNENVTKSLTGVEKLEIKEINKIPVLFGEKDLFKIIQLLPGIKSANEGSSGIYIRGGSSDQNLILLDEAPVYNASHLMGFFSTFNSDAIKDVTVYKGTSPSQYGGRIASAIDIKMKEGNNQEFHINGGIGLISSNLSIEGPIMKNKGSFLLTGRRTYADLFLKLSKDESIRNNQLYFYDLNAKINYQLSEKDRVYLSGYLGRDKLGFGDEFGIDWGNITGTLRWNHVFSPKLFSNTSFIVSNFDYGISIKNSNDDFNVESRVIDYNLKQEFQFFPNPQHSLRFGFNTIYHNVTPGATISASLTNFEYQKRHGLQNSIWISDDIKAAKWLNITGGLRLSLFSVIGGGDFYTLDAKNNIIDTTTYSSGQFVKNYFYPEPRLSASIIFNESNSVKLSYTRNTQSFHLLSNSTSTNPTDKWLISTNNIKPQVGDQVSLGFFRNFDNNNYELNIEGYYKVIQNLLDSKDGADYTNTNAIETQLLFGKGRSYGIEVLFKKRNGRFTGWISYSLSRSEQKIEGINNGNWYPAKQDRTHDISVVGMFDVSDKLNVSATWVYHTGNAVTFPSGKYFINNQVVFYYTERNGYRMPDFHRLDIGGTLKLGSGKRFSSELTFGCYNVYGRENAFTIEFRQSLSDPNSTEAVQSTLFRWIPYVSWNFKF